MITPIQKRKLTHLFNILDADKNGILQPDDFTIVADRISNLLGYSKDSNSRLSLEARSFRLFIQLLTDLNKEEASIYYEEWIELFDKILLKNERLMYSYIQRTAAYMFMLFDQNGDQVVSEEEYMDMFRAYNISDEYVRIAFKKLDDNGDGVLQKDEIIYGFHDFFMSSDPDAKGNWIFGKWDSVGSTA